MVGGDLRVIKMKKCVIKPTEKTCKTCLEMQMQYNDVFDCNECFYKGFEYHLIDYITNFWGTYGLVTDGENVEKVPIHRIQILKEEKQNEDNN